MPSCSVGATSTGAAASAGAAASPGAAASTAAAACGATAAPRGATTSNASWRCRWACRHAGDPRSALGRRGSPEADGFDEAPAAKRADTRTVGAAGPGLRAGFLLPPAGRRPLPSVAGAAGGASGRASSSLAAGGPLGGGGGEPGCGAWAAGVGPDPDVGGDGNHVLSPRRTSRPCWLTAMRPPAPALPSRRFCSRRCGMRVISTRCPVVALGAL